ncbi:hypothetical protein NFB56_16015 [Yersinia ruckeri]|uniref:hypothetical protein n=1 Tax=Yersinia ruckeri TaxID=29486 RepID=UPI002237BC89|nr:hypothetical protein [Yersinia ruckeri]MCW6550344.1 hypothetical protein [Yersinia ruckeri]
MSYEQLYLRMKALEKERDELHAFIVTECNVRDEDGYYTENAICHPQYEGIEHVV